ncbi:MAG: calcium-binding protein [Pseudomonadota bacterium]
MATATAYYGVDMATASGWYGNVTIATSTHIQVASGIYVQNYFGSGFTYNNNTVTGGTVTSTNYFESGTKIYEITGASASAVTVANYISNGDIQGAFSYVFSGADRFNGSAYADRVNAYGGNDTIYGNGGNDYLIGGVGNDVLYGGIGYDLLIGGAGADTMRGNGGNDTYIVDNTGDKAIELSGQGSDLVKSNVTFTLGADVEALILTGTNAVNGYGNSLANALTGNNVANTLAGYLGNDILRGNGGNDILNGGAGNDNLIGGAGKDSLAGGAGKDFFVFNTALGPGNVDTLKDYTRADDTIRLENSIFTSLSTTGVLNAGNFKIGINAADANDFIIYNNNTGALYYDADGNGAGSKVLIANVFSSGTTPASLSAGEFVVI